jgi:exodeoxyribonuclease VII small subunit
MRELESILSEIERGELGVEESLVRYERGAYLIAHCRGVLNKAQEQIEAVGKTPQTEADSSSADEESDANIEQ